MVIVFDCRHKVFGIFAIGFCRVMTKLTQITVLHKYICLGHYVNQFFSVLQYIDILLLKGALINSLYCLCCKDYLCFKTEYLAHMGTQSHNFKA